MDRDQTINDLMAGARAGTISRREFIQRLGALGVAPAVVAALAASVGTTQAPHQARAGAIQAQTGSEATAGIPGPPWQGGVQGGTGRVAFNDDRAMFDPPLAFDWTGYYGIANFYRGLTYFNENAEPQLDLAESMDVSDDAMGYVFKLKRGVTFHNGRELTTRDFKFTFERSSSQEIASWVQAFLGAVKGHADFVAGNAGEIEGIKIVDDYTLELELERPDITIPAVVGIPPFYALPSEEVISEGQNFRFMMGTGPWKLENLDEGNRRYVATKFEDYVYAPQLPYFDSLEWNWGVTPQLQFLRVGRDELEATGNGIASAQALQVQQSPDQADQLALVDSFSIEWVEFDVTREPFNDVRVRQAFNYAFNPDRPQRLLANSTGHFYPPRLLGFDAGLPVYEYDPDRARALLREAGYDGGLNLILPILGSGQGALEQMLQQDLLAVGVNVDLTTDPAGVYDLGSNLRGTYPLWARGWGMGLPDPSEIVNSLVGTNAPSNFGGYSNAEIDRLGMEGQSEIDRGRRAEIYAEIERLLIEDAAFLFLGVSRFPYFHRDELKNFVWEPVNYQHWDRYWLEA